MKKILICIILALAMVFAFTACGGSDSGATDEATTVAEETTAAEETAAPEEGEIIDSFTSGTDTYHFIEYAKPRYDEVEEDENGHRTYTIYVEELDGSEEAVGIDLYFADFKAEGLEATRDLMKKSLEEDSGVDAEHIKDQTIDGADAIRYVRTIEDRESVTTTIFHGGNYIDVTVYSTLKGAPSDTAKEIYQEVVNSIAIAE